MKRWSVAIAGLGGVGQAIAALLLARRPRYCALYEADVRITAACGSRAGALDEDGLDAARLAAGALIPGLSGPGFMASAPVDVLIEAGPTDLVTGAPGLGYIASALEAGRHVVAVSKGALVLDHRRLRDLARRHGVLLKVGAATGAGLPTIDLLDRGLSGCEVLSVQGILNATTNHLLTAMTERDLSLAEALAEAQRAGIAERDPAMDVEGWDTACKTVVLANAGLGADLSLGDVAVSGIKGVTPAQVRSWRQEGLVPKLIGRIDRTGTGGTGLRASVGVEAVPATSVVGQVGGTGKVVRIVTTEFGEVTMTGGGPEPLATAATALKDLEHILMAGR